MTQAEQRAWDEYPVFEFNGVDFNRGQRETYCKGYKQAEEDIKGSLLQWLEYVKNLWSQTSASLAAMQTLQMVIDKLQEEEK